MSSEFSTDVSSDDGHGVATLAIVYQFGKVASTSLVAALNDIENVEAVQSHFLGSESLTQILKGMVNPNLPEYFFNHQLGQFVENAKLTRRLNRILAGESDTRLLVISLTREPLDWFRSSISQDIEGYLPRFQILMDRLGAAPQNDGQLVQLAVTRLMGIFLGIFEKHGGVDAVIKKLASDPQAIFAGTAIQDDHQNKMFFYMMLRPFSWFHQHFEQTLKIKLDKMAWNDGILETSDGNGDYVIFGYEDVEQNFRRCLNNLGFQDIPSLHRKNVSEQKQLAKDVKRSFQSPVAARLKAKFSESEYAARFGYAAAHSTSVEK